MKECPKCGTRYSNEATFCSKDASSLVEISADSDILGMVIDGRWRVDSKLGEGGMGAVYQGRQVNIDRKVAIKTLRRELTSSLEFMARFEQEARAAGKISHPNCVTVFESGRADSLGGMLYLVMEYLEGEVLSGRLTRQHLTLEESLRVAIQVASGLAAAHEMGIIHRDLKPDNIFLVSVPGDDIHAKVLDFGIAKVSDGDSKMTKSGMIMGTPQYMSPEQCHGRAVDVRTDIYALGTIIYEMLSGRTPFNSPTPITVLFEVVNSPPPSLTDLGVRVPREVEAYVMRMLAKDAADRPGSAMEVKRELERLLLTSTHTSSRQAEAALAASPTLAMPVSTTVVPKAKGADSKRVVGVLVVSLLLLGLVVSAWAVAQSIDKKRVASEVATTVPVENMVVAEVKDADAPSSADVEQTFLASATVVNTGVEQARSELEAAQTKTLAVAPTTSVKKPKTVKSAPKNDDELTKVMPEIEIAPEPLPRKTKQTKTTTDRRNTIDELREARKSANDASKKIKKARKDFESVLDSLGPAP